MKIRRALPLALFCLLALPVATSFGDDILDFLPVIITRFPNPVRVVRDVTYHDDWALEGPEAMHQLDIYYSPKTKNSKVVFFVHGGAWRSGDKSSYDEMGRTLTGFHGLTVVATNYELSNETDGNATHPDHIQDVARAFAWTKANIAPYGDPNNIFIFGQSAGAHLVSLLGTDEQYLTAEGCSLADVKGVISYSGSYDLYDLTVMVNNPLGLTAGIAGQYALLFATTFPPVTEPHLNSASPEWKINLNQPPFLVVSVVDDMYGFPEEYVNFIEAIEGLTPAPEVENATLLREDFSDATWANATAMAQAQGGLFENATGHYAEMVSINTREWDSRAAMLVVDFVDSH